jgi:hypothetical protein
MVQLDLLQGAQPVVGAVTDRHHRQLFVEQGNCRQDAAAVQAVRIQVVGLEIGRRDETDTLREQAHRAGDAGSSHR